MNQDRVEFLMSKVNLPKFPMVNISAKYPELVDFIKNPQPYHFECDSFILHKIARDVAFNLALEFIKENDVKFPPYYLPKQMFIEAYRDFKFKNIEDDIVKWNNSSLIIFDGIDEITNQQDLSFIASFLSPLIIKNAPLIMISSNRLTEEVLNKYNFVSFGILMEDVKKIKFSR